MAEVFQGTVDIQDDAGTTISITLNGNTGDASLGGNGRAGDLVIRDAAGNERIRIDGATGQVSIFDNAASEVVTLVGGTAALRLGGPGASGNISLNDASDATTVDIQAGTATVRLGGGGREGDIQLQNTEGSDHIRLEGGPANAWLGGNGADGDLVLFATSGDNATLGDSTIHLGGGAGDARLGGAGVSGNLTVQAPGGEGRVQVNANGNLLLGGNGAAADVVLFAEDGDNATIEEATIHLNAALANLRLGGQGHDGDVILREAGGLDRVRLDAGGGNGFFGGNEVDGDLLLFARHTDNVTGDEATIHLDGAVANLRMGGEGQDGDVILRDAIGSDRIRLDAGSGNGFFGGNGVDGDLILFAFEGDNVTAEEATIHLDGANGNLTMGGPGHDGDVILRDAVGNDRIRMDAGEGNVFLGGNGVDGDLLVFDDSGDNVTFDEATIHLNGQAGDIVLRNADCAEEFDLAGEETRPGTVVVIGRDGRLHASSAAYDRRVAGVISGAGECKPGIVLGRNPSASPRVPVALLGKVYCKVDAAYGAIDVGDLLTTSPNSGHAMKAADPNRSFGAVLGKALAGHESGPGLIPVLVAMQ